MSLDVSATFKIDPGAIAALCQPGGLVSDGAERAARLTAERARQAAQGYGLVDTGRLVGSIEFVIDHQQDRVSAHVGTPVEYAIYQHQGTSRGVRAKPFLTDALAQLTANDFGGP